MSEPEVTTMRIQDYDPNNGHIDADQYTEEQRLMRDLTIRAEARFTSLMATCKDLRAGTDPVKDIDVFVDKLLNLFFDGRMELASTEQHRNVSALIMKAALANRFASHEAE